MQRQNKKKKLSQVNFQDQQARSKFDFEQTPIKRSPQKSSTSIITRSPQNDEEKSNFLKAKEVKYSIQEWILMKSFTFSMIAVIILLILAMFILDLVGGYLPIMAFSLLVSIALRPTKDNITFTLKRYLGLLYEPANQSSYFSRSIMSSIISNFKDLLNCRKDPKLYSQKTAKIFAIGKNFDPTSDVYSILITCALYILISRFGFVTVLYIILTSVIGDLVFKLLLDLFVFLPNQVDIIKKFKFKIQKSHSFSEMLDSCVVTLVITGFIILGAMVIVLMIGMLAVDLENILSNLKDSTQASIKTINHIVASKFGVENVIDENFAANFFKNYNESIYSYLPNEDMRDLYVTLTASFSNTSNMSPKSFFSGIEGFMNDIGSTQMSKPLDEMEDCLEKTEINMDFRFARYLEYVYCASITYGKKLSIDPYQLLDRSKEIFGFIFRILFGTIFAQLFLISKATISYILNSIFFCVSVYYLLGSKESVIVNATNLLPLDDMTKLEIQEFTVNSVKGSFLCSIKLFIYHFVFTWLCFDVLELQLGFIISIGSAFSSIIPLIPPYVLCIPHALYIYFARGNLVLAILFPIVYMLISNKAYTDIYEKSINIHPYVTGLSIVMGIYAFNLQGIIYGPLLMCMTIIIYNIAKKYGANTAQILKMHSTESLIREYEALKKKN